MKQKHFYSHLIQITDITLDLADLDMSRQERLHLLALVDANIHSTIIKTVLSELEKDEKKVFLKNLLKDDHDLIWQHLKQKTNNLEEKIKKSAEALLREMKNDIQKVSPKP